MTEQLADYRKSEAGPCADRGKRVPEIMEANVVELGVLADRSPRRIQVGPRIVGIEAGNDIDTVTEEGVEHGHCCAVQDEGLSASLSGRNAKTAIKIDLVTNEMPVQQLFRGCYVVA